MKKIIHYAPLTLLCLLSSHIGLMAAHEVCTIPKQGPSGPTGSTGTQGPTGMSSSTGPTGPTGMSINGSGFTEYAYAWNSSPQSLAPSGQSVTFSNATITGILPAISWNGSDTFTILQDGNYLINFNGFLTSDASGGLYVGGLQTFVDGVAQLPSFIGFAQPFSIVPLTEILTLSAGQTLTFQYFSNFNPKIPMPITSVMVTITQVQALP